MPSKVSDQLLAEGAPIKLLDGRVLHLRYGMRALKKLEDDFGSTSSIDEAITNIASGEGKAFTTLTRLIAAGLIGEVDEDELLDLLDSREYLSYGTAIGEAFSQAFPEANGEAGKAAKDSPGETGTTPQPSPSDEPQTNSGS